MDARAEVAKIGVTANSGHSSGSPAIEDGAHNRHLIPTGNRLSRLPVVFSLEMAAAELGLSKEVAQSYIQRWKGYGLLAGVGKTGIYINLDRSPDVAEYLPEAVAMAVRRPVIETGEVIAAKGGLAASGCAPETRSFAVYVGPASRSLPRIDGVKLCPRPDWWIDAMSSSRATVRTASPQMAIADLLLNDYIATARAHCQPPNPAADLLLSSSAAAAVEKCLDTLLRAAPRRGMWVGMTGATVLRSHLSKSTSDQIEATPPQGCPKRHTPSMYECRATPNRQAPARL